MYGLEPSCLGGKTCCGMEVTDDRFYAQKFVDVVYELAWKIGRHDGLDMIEDVVGFWDFI